MRGITLAANDAKRGVLPAYPTEESDPTSLTHAGAATEPVREFDPVAYLRVQVRDLRRRLRYAFARGVLVGIAVGVVLSSVAMEVFA